jgi:pyruvate dehydrogenase E2 component (dihydrolipoamide acetyltransferase)
MRVEIVMPRMGQSMEEGHLMRWMVPVGGKVEQGKPVAEIETDKAIVEMEALVSGTLVSCLVPPDTTVPVGTPIAVIDDGRPEPPAKPQDVAGAGTEAIEAPTSRVNASPAARRFAAENGVDLHQVRPTGPDGRVSKEDVEAYLRAKSGAGPVSAASPTGAPVPELTGNASTPAERSRQATARLMAESKASIPHFYVSIDIEMDRALALRQSYKQRGKAITVNDLILRAVTLALQEFPGLNSTFEEGRIVRHPEIHLAVAVAPESGNGLISPVVHNCERLSLVELSAQANELVQRARQSRLQMQDLAGAAFTVSNLGMFGVRHFEAVITPPQAAVLAVGGLRNELSLDENRQLKMRQMLTVTLSADHRITDGAEVARFLAALKRLLEDAFSLEG